MIGKQEMRRVSCQPDLGDPGAERLDRPHDFAAEDVPIEGEVAGDVSAREIDEVERLDGQPGFGLTRLHHPASGSSWSGVTIRRRPRVDDDEASARSGTVAL